MALALGGCLERKLKPLNPCLVSGVVAEIAVTNIDKVDLLFVVDNSGSMREEQVALAREFPKLVQVLASGDRDFDGMNDFPPAKDLHLGVVSSDMGLVGIQGIPGCEGLGDDGIMNSIPGPGATGCQTSYPPFISYTAGVNTPEQAASDFGCIASLGTEGCGFEQQLEAGLKALWPETDIDPATGLPFAENRILFLGDAAGFGRFGHGDRENNGFLRNDPVQGISLIAIVMVTDEEDCSSADTRHFTPEQYLPPGDPLAMQDLNLRCFHNKQNLYDLDRYVNGFRALRPGQENLVIFAAIAGVPPDLVSSEALSRIDFGDQASRDNHYATILADQRMQEVPDPTRTPEQGGNLTPSCVTDNGKAYPPRRFVEVAQRFGENGVIQSICQDDFGPAMDAIIEVIAKQLGAVCLPRPLVRNSDGFVGCNVVWELPPPNQAPANTPTTCGQQGWEFLRVPEGRDTVSDKGGQVCTVAQLSVVGDTTGASKEGDNEGWYYDNFSEEVMKECTGDEKQRVAFTPKAKPPTGVTVKLECLNEAQTLADNRTDVTPGIEQPSVGDPCKDVVINGREVTDDAACAVRLADGTDDTTMFCHPKLNVCVRSCSTDADCPAAWVCDDRGPTLSETADPETRPNGSPICVNPTCGSG
ncbi:MAG: VWA domain-containing protein [Myxococcales bacterium]|nr:VWA domain-containing protein [Myxococcales bacterium]